MCLQSNDAVSDEVQTQLMGLAIREVARAIAAQPPAPLSTGVKPAGGKPAASKGKKDEPKPVQVCVLAYTLTMPCAVLHYRCTCCTCIFLLHGKTVGGVHVGIM